MAELSLIDSITTMLKARGGRVVRGIGDDAPIVKALKLCVTSVDTVVEGLTSASTTRSELPGHRLAGAGGRAYRTSPRWGPSPARHTWHSECPRT